jgi:hypothetical protein
MGIQGVEHDTPLGGLRLASNQALHMSQGILFGTRGSPRGDEDLSAHHIEIEKPAQGSLPDVLELAAQPMARLHGQIGMFALDGLHAG